MKFFSFWRSLASFRVRIALKLKNLPAEIVFVDIDADAHRAEHYRNVNPQMALPALVRTMAPRCSSRLPSSNISTKRILSRCCCRRMPAAAPGCAGWR